MRDIEHFIMPLAMLVAIMTLIIGAGFLIYADTNRAERAMNTCIEAGMQWVNGDCLK